MHLGCISAASRLYLKAWLTRGATMRRYVRGAHQPWSTRLSMGCAFVTLLLIIVLGPLLLFSNASPISTPLPVTSASLSLGLAISSGGTFPLGHISRVEIANLPPTSPLRTAPFYAAACAAATDAAEAEHTCGYSYLLGDWCAEITPRSRRDRVELTPRSSGDHAEIAPGSEPGRQWTRTSALPREISA